MSSEETPAAIEPKIEKVWNGSETNLVLIECATNMVHRYKGNIRRLSFQIEDVENCSEEDIKALIEEVRVEPLLV